jgi:hypothetical protein
MIKTTILAYWIAFLGLLMISGGIWGFFYLRGRGQPAPIRYDGMAFAMTCGGFAMLGVAQALRILLDLVAAMQQMH